VSTIAFLSDTQVMKTRQEAQLSLTTTRCLCKRRADSLRITRLLRGLPVTVRHGSSLSGRRLSVGLRRRSSSPVFCHIKDVCCETNLHAATMETGVLQLQITYTVLVETLNHAQSTEAVEQLESAFQLICDKLNLAFNDLSGY